MHRFVFGLSLAVVLTGCEAGTQLQPLGPTQSTLSRSERARVPDLTVQAAVWRGKPARLAARLTPMAVTIRNTTGAPIRVNFADVSIFDERGNRYAVVSPFMLTTAQRQAPRAAAEAQGFQLQLATYPKDPNQDENDQNMRQLDQSSDGMASPQGLYPGMGVPPLYEPLRAPQHRFKAPRGFTLTVRERPLLGEDLHAVGTTPPGYDNLVVSWSSIQPDRPVSTEVLNSALAEGVIEPGGEVQGFVYFENPTLHGNLIHLVWNVHAADGTAMGALTSSFRVINR